MRHGYKPSSNLLLYQLPLTGMIREYHSFNCLWLLISRCFLSLKARARAVMCCHSPAPLCSALLRCQTNVGRPEFSRGTRSSAASRGWREKTSEERPTTTGSFVLPQSPIWLADADGWTVYDRELYLIPECGAVFAPCGLDESTTKRSWFWSLLMVKPSEPTKAWRWRAILFNYGDFGGLLLSLMHFPGSTMRSFIFLHWNLSQMTYRYCIYNPA